MRFYQDFRFYLLSISALIIMLRFLLSKALIENYYSRKGYLWVKWMLANSINHVASMYYYLLALLVLLIVIMLLIRCIRFFRKKHFKAAVFHSVYSIASTAATCTAIFLMSWGFNYGRLPLTTLLGFQRTELSWSQLQSEADYVVHSCNQEAINFHQMPNAAQMAVQVPIYLEDTVRIALQSVLRKYKIPCDYKVRCVPLHPAGLMFKQGISGEYLGVGYYDAGNPSLLCPTTIAHEMSHGYGIADEGECNFLGWLACAQSANAYLRYSAALEYGSYILGTIRMNDDSLCLKYLNQLSTLVLRDKDSIRQQMSAYRSVLPRFSAGVRDAYLKTQGKQNGLLNYDEMIPLVYSWRKQSLPANR
jgi:hypothetical protein